MSRFRWKRNGQLFVVLLCALTVKLYYSTASANQLRWILAPTTLFVEMVSGIQFEFESHAGYITRDRSFLIAASCAGVNFLITSFLMLSLRRLWRARSQNGSDNIAWGFIPAAALFAYLATLVANTVRISIALRLQRMPLDIIWLSPNQFHRFEGIFIYFGFLLLLFLVSERMSSQNVSGLQAHAGCPRGHLGLFRQFSFPLLVYYAAMLGIPLANGAYRTGTVATDFWEHTVFVLLTPLLLILPLAALRFHTDQRASVSAKSGATRIGASGFEPRTYTVSIRGQAPRETGKTLVTSTASPVLSYIARVTRHIPRRA
jgi:exosortase K